MKFQSIIENKDVVDGAFSQDSKVNELIQTKINPNFGQALKLIYMWVKQNHINQRQFNELIEYVTKE